ncbi:hypothetical protein BH20CHL6_BH20CHL6_03710 [soil metagenome]
MGRLGLHATLSPARGRSTRIRTRGKARLAAARRCRWASWKRSPVGCRRWRRAIEWSSPSGSPAGIIGCARATSTHSARRPRSGRRTKARHCSATPSCMGRCRAARRSTCACRMQGSGHQGPRGSPRRPFRVPLGRSADRLAGNGVRRRPGWGQPRDLGLGPIGEMCVRVARQRGIERIFAVDRGRRPTRACPVPWSGGHRPRRRRRRGGQSYESIRMAADPTR